MFFQPIKDSAVFLALAGLFFTSSPAVAGPRVVVSISPLHSLVAGVMAGVGSPELLIRGGASPHTYAMKPSDARALENADLIVWIGEDLERFLAKPVAALGVAARSLEVMKAPGVQLLYPGRPDDAEGGVHAHENGHDRDTDDAHGHHHDANSADPHIWLSPENAAAITAAVAEALATADPDRAEHYRANSAQAAERLATLDAEIKGMLAPVSDDRFLVFHDAYRYFEEAFGLRNAGALSVNPERMPGARHLSELRKKVADLGVACVFREPQFMPKLAEAIVSGTSARLGVLDPLGAGLEPGADLYFRLMHGNAEALVECLKEQTAG